MSRLVRKSNKNFKEGANRVIYSKTFNRTLKVAQILGLVIILGSSIGLAEPSVDTFTALIASWTEKVGGIIAFIGAVLFALGWRNDDPGERIKGVKTFIAGAMIFAIAKGYKEFM